MEKTSDMPSIPIAQTPVVLAAQAALAKAQTRYAELQEQIGRFESIERRPPVEFLNRPVAELTAQVNLARWREDLAQAALECHEAQAALEKARYTEGHKIRRAIAERKPQAVSALREKLIAAREANEVVRSLEVLEQTLLGEPVNVMNWPALAYSDSLYSSKLDEWIKQVDSTFCIDHLSSATE